MGLPACGFVANCTLSVTNKEQFAPSKQIIVWLCYRVDEKHIQFQPLVRPLQSIEMFHYFVTCYILLSIHMPAFMASKSIMLIEKCVGIPTEETDYDTKIFPCNNPLLIQYYVTDILANKNGVISNPVTFRISCKSMIFLEPLFKENMINFTSDDYNCVNQANSKSDDNGETRDKAVENMFMEIVETLRPTTTLLITDEHIGVSKNAYLRQFDSFQINLQVASCYNENINKILNSSYSRTIMICDLPRTSHIIKEAKEFGLFSDTHTWVILTDQIQPINDYFSSIKFDAIWDVLVAKFPSKYKLWAQLQVQPPEKTPAQKPSEVNSTGNEVKFRVVRILKKCKEDSISSSDLGAMTSTQLVSTMKSYAPERRLYNCTILTALKTEEPLVVSSFPNPRGVEYRFLTALEYALGYQAKYVDAQQHKIWTETHKDDDTNLADFGAPFVDDINPDFQNGHLSLPIYLTRYTAVIKTPSAAIGADSYIQPFEITVWGVIFLVTVGSALFWAAVRTIYDYFEERKITLPSCISTLWNTSYDIFCTIIEQGITDIPDQASARIILATINLQTVLVTTCYSSVLISFLTDSKILFPFTTLEEFVDRDYKFIGYEGDAFFDDLKSAKGGIYQKLSKNSRFQIVDNKTNMWDRVLKDKRAHVALYVVNQMKTGNDNNFTTSISHVSRVSRSIYFRKNFPHQRLFTLLAHKLVESGIMARLINQFTNTLHYQSGETDNTVSAIGLERMFFLLEIIGVGVVCALVSLIFESLIYAQKYGNYWKYLLSLLEFNRIKVHHTF